MIQQRPRPARRPWGRAGRTAAVALLVVSSTATAGSAAVQSEDAARAHHAFAQTSAKPPRDRDATSIVMRITVESQALSGNLEGDSPRRDVSVYLPPGYESSPKKRYPVLYMLHGFTQTDLSYFAPDAGTNLPQIADRTLEAGTASEMIIVTPNAMTVHGGSNYSSGATTGDWETFVSDELVSSIDARFRTIRDREGRGLAGHSMGGYGALRIGMRHPEVFSALYVLSSCCIDRSSNIPDTVEEMAAMEDYTAHPENYPDGAPSSIRTAVAAAAAWAPNPTKAPLYFDSPVVDGQLDLEVLARMTANRPLAMVDQYISHLRQQELAFDVGDADTNIRNNLTRLSAVLDGYGVPHSFEVYEGNHGNRVPQRLEEEVLPFFSAALRPASRK